MANLLIIDDDEELCCLLQEYLLICEMQLEYRLNCTEGLKQIEQQEYDLVILDVMLPDGDGFDLLQKIRKFSEVPIIMLTARGEDIDRIIGLEYGADDYVPKPCNPREISARIKSILRRTQRIEPVKTRQTLGNLLINEDEYIALVDGTNAELTVSEYKILSLLMANEGKVVLKEDLYISALEREFSNYDRSLDMHVSNLRKKMTDISKNAPTIKTHRGLGYSIQWPNN